jgi:hypothetical protein
MPQEPVILAYFSQSSGNESLDLLQKEYISLKQRWEDNQYGIELRIRSSEETTTDNISKDARKYKEGLILLHFSGHAGPNHLAFQEENGLAEGLAELIGNDAKYLKLVVLNGCSTANQVNYFFKNGAKAVIATKSSVQDKLAFEFSKIFYEHLHTETIKYAYENAISSLKSKEDNKPLLPSNLSNQFTTVEIDKIRGIGISELPFNDENIWGLYVLKGYESVLTDKNWWKLEEIKTTSTTLTALPKIANDKRFTCGRDEHKEAFDEYVFSSSSKNIKHFFVFGERQYSPDGLSHKIVFDYYTNNRKNRYLYLPDPSYTQVPFNEFYIKLNAAHFKEPWRIAYQINDRLKSYFETTTTTLWASTPVAPDNLQGLLNEMTERLKISHFDHSFLFLNTSEDVFQFDSVKSFINELDKINGEFKSKLFFFWNVYSGSSVSNGGVFGAFTSLFRSSKTNSIEKNIRKYFGIDSTQDIRKSGTFYEGKVGITILSADYSSSAFPNTKDIEEWEESIREVSSYEFKMPDFTGDVVEFELALKKVIEYCNQ